MSQKGKAINAPATEDPMDLQPGSKVEVNHEDDVCPRAWYTAIIMEGASSTNDKRYVVQFTNLYQYKNSGTKLSKEYNSVDILPLPPPQPPRKFKAGGIVEGYFDDGWYEGKIDQVLDDDKYIFRMSSMFLLFGVKQLRLHRTWLNRNWLPPLDESELAVEEEDSTETDNAEATKAGTAWFAATIVKPVGNNRYLIRFETLRTEDDTGFLEKDG
ncbi:hypothetical protein V6Z11_A13G011800 [Gossypium hirsutum]